MILKPRFRIGKSLAKEGKIDIAILVFFHHSIPSSGASEKIGKLMVAFADDLKPVRSVSEGNIAVLSGMRETRTGDTLVARHVELKRGSDHE